MERRKCIDEATEELAALIENHFNDLPPEEREAKSSAFHEAVAKIGTRQKSATNRSLGSRLGIDDRAES